VRELSFGMRAGEILGLIGPNGAGKSTMFNLITGVLPSDGGEILFLGERIDGLAPSQIARRAIARNLPARQSRRRDVGAGERRAGRRTCAGATARCAPCCAPSAPRRRPSPALQA